MAREVDWGQAASPAMAQWLFSQAQVLYPFLLLLSYGVVFAVHSVYASQHQEDVEQPKVTGPGGKPLPVTRIKLEKPRAPPSTVHEFSQHALYCFKTGIAIIVLSMMAHALHVVHQCMQAKWVDIDRFTNDQLTVYLLGGVFFWGYIGFSLAGPKLDKPNGVHFSIWCIGLAYELAILLAFFLVFHENLGYLQSDKPNLELRSTRRSTPGDATYLALLIIRSCALLGLVGVYSCLSGIIQFPRWSSTDTESQRVDSAESAPSLNSQASAHENGNGHAHGSANGNPGSYRARRRTSEARRANGIAKGSRQKQTEFAFYRPDKLPHRSWWEYIRGYHVFFPYLWPAKEPRLQVLVCLCFALVILQRIVNVLVPIRLGLLVNALAGAEVAHGPMPWSELFFFLALKLMQGPSAILGSARAMLWIPVTQHSYISLQTAAFEHVHSLSLDFHLGKRTGELLSALNKGGSVNAFLEQTTFSVAPTLLDLFVAIGFFWTQFGPIYALCATIITFSYLVLTIRMASTRADQRREMVNADREEEAVKNDSITAYETVKYFNAEAFEFKRYRAAIETFQNAEARVTAGMNMMNMWQTVVFICGMLVVMTIAAYEVVTGVRDMAEFIMVMTYLNQLQGPLNFFGSFYRTVQQAMISGERLLELFKIQPNMVDKPGASTLEHCDGSIQWKKVDFDYANSPALRDLSFECKPGTTTAFVGESGGGKSTIFRLMFRYYNCMAGTIEIDGRDVKDFTIDSVRRAIGVVPQDTILFHETIEYNLRYANQDCTQEEMYEACRAASIHDRIMSFPDKYQTKVGERGMRLSGGEKQRISIARTILKKPKIILLDEATSALDSETEQQIQAKLFQNRELGAGKTLMIIAHRLSTITHAEQILVLHRGRIVERGTHAELIRKQGRYHSMWEKQARAEEMAKAAAVAKEEARRAMKEARLAKDSSDEHSDDGGDSDHTFSSHNLPTAPTTPAVELSGLHMSVS
ncbi:unnamed protein product [Discula destructiva]